MAGFMGTYKQLQAAAKTMADESGWIQVASFGTGLEADIARQELESAEIPVVMRSDQAGIYGLSFQGALPGGVKLYVPAQALKQARELLAEMRSDGAT
jgi:hypothetical protein